MMRLRRSDCAATVCCLALRRYARMVHWSHSSSWFIYPATSVIVALNPDTAEQRFFLGHTAPVCALQLSREHRLVASAQEGAKIDPLPFLVGLFLCPLLASSFANACAAIF